MDAKIKKDWTDALRSGAYAQGRSALHTVVQTEDPEHPTRDEFCCLGVLCDLAVQAGAATRGEIIESLGEYPYETSDGRSNTYYLPYAIGHWAGLSGDDGTNEHDDPDPYLEIDGVVKNASVHNDNGVTFAQLADAIDAQL